MDSQDTYLMPEHGWTCFHCGETFRTPGMAREHFGADPLAIPGCMIKLGDERRLLGALRDAEAELARYRAEDSETERRMAAMQCDHGRALRDAEESGYAKGIVAARRQGESMSEVPILIFFREDMFYPIEAMPGIPLCQQAEDNAVLNPGTTRVEDVDGNILWQLQ